MKRTRGVYFLANDRVIDLAIAFLNSFRKFNPSLSLCLVPYDGEIERLKALAAPYGFEIFADEGVLADCDAISVRFHGAVVGQYRKLAIWEGAFDDFIYIDVDTVVLQGVEFAFGFVMDYDFMTATSNYPALISFVWKETVYGTGVLTTEQIAYATNTGFIVSQKGMLPLEEVHRKLETALTLQPHMELMCTEQPLLNFLFVTSGKKYSSITVFREVHKRWDIPIEAWAGTEGATIRDGLAYLEGDRPLNIFLVHWAGEWQPGERDRELLSRSAISEMPVISNFMPYRKLWEYYRNLR